MHLISRNVPLIALAASAALIGCGGDDGGGGDAGDVQVFVEPEDTISGGLGYMSKYNAPKHADMQRERGGGSCGSGCGCH